MARPSKDLPTRKTKGEYEYAYFRGKSYYLGKAGSAAAKSAWADLVRRAAENPDALDLSPDEILVPEVFAAYLASPDSPPANSRRLEWIELAAQLLVADLPVGASSPETAPDYSGVAAVAFSPPMFKAWRRWLTTIVNENGRQRYAASTWKKLGQSVVIVWTWAVSEGILPAATLEGLRAALKAPAGTPRPSRKGVAADPEHFDRAVAKMAPGPAAIARLQRLCAARPSELCAMRPCDLHRSGVVDVPGFGRCDLDKAGVWVLVLDKHKTAHRGKFKAVWFTPEAQAVLSPFLEGVGPEELVFSPARERAKADARKRAARKSKLKPYDLRRKKAEPRKRPGLRYGPVTLRAAWDVACKRAGVPRIRPYQIRHLAKREITDKFGTEAARVMLGHSSTDTTDLYGGFSFAMVGKVAGNPPA